MEFIINCHKELFSDTLKYEIIDPEFKSNSINNIIVSQTDIIQYIISNSMGYIQINYQDKYQIQYSISNDDQINLSPLEPNSVHLLRLIGLDMIIDYSLDFDIKVDSEYIRNIIIEINKYIYDETEKKSPMDYCTVCGNKLKLKGLNKITHCASEHCTLQSKHLVMDNRITEMYHKDPYLCEILIDLLIQGSSHPKGNKIFKPLPKMKDVSNLNDLVSVLKKEHLNLDISHIADSPNDIALYRKIGNTAYAIISNAISDNYFSLSTIEKFQTEVLNKALSRLEKNSSAFDSKNVKFIGLNYSYEIESKFTKEYFLFHGSPIYSWYPIIKNGLKVMSGSEFMANGAAHGNGIYLSDRFSMSYRYSLQQKYNISYNKNRSIVGVFEIAGKTEPHKKTQNIFVIGDDKLMLLRYLIVIENNIDDHFHEELSSYFIKYLGSINKINETKSINIKNKRFSAEMKLLKSNSKVYNIDIIDETKNWKIELNEIEGKKIILNIFFNDYPRLPPKILMDCNQQFICNVCDEESNITIPEINPSKWIITTNLSKIVDMIYNCIIMSM